MEAALTNPSGRMTLGSSVVRIGSAQDNHVVINDPKVSPYHAEIRPEGRGEYSHTIVDLGSTTGTFVNERRLDYNVPIWLRPNDAIRIGDAVFNYEVTGAPQVDETERIDRSSGRASAEVMGAKESIDAPAELPLRPSREVPPQMGSTPYGGPGQGGAASDLSSGWDANPSLPQGPPLHYPATPAPPYSQRDESGGREGIDRRPAFAPPPTGGIAPVSPLGSFSPTYTGAAINLGPTSLLEKENRGKLWFAGGLTVLVILLVAFLFGSFHSPGRTLDTFCSALLSGDYQTAYNQFSPGLQGTGNESQFAVLVKSKRITSCTHSSPNVSGNSAVATIITNSSPASTVWLIQDRSFDWKIDSLSGL